MRFNNEENFERLKHTFLTDIIGILVLIYVSNVIKHLDTKSFWIVCLFIYNTFFFFFCKLLWITIVIDITIGHGFSSQEI